MYYDATIHFVGCIDSIELLLVYKIVLIIFLTYSFYTYEIYYTFDFIFLRIKLKKWIISKLVTSIFLIAMFDLLHVGFVFIMFFKSIDFSLHFIAIQILFDIFLCLVVIFLINVFKNKSVIFILVTILGLFMFSNFKIMIFLISFPILIFLNIATKRFLKKR